MLFMVSSLFAELSLIDSLEQKLTDSSGDLKADYYTQLAIEYSKLRQYDKAITYCEFAIETTNSKERLARIYYNLSKIQFYNNKYEEALTALDKSLAFKRAIGDKLGEANVLLAGGTIYSNLGKYDKAIENYKLAKPLYIELGDNDGLFSVTNDMAIILRDQGKLDEALNNFKDGLKLVENNAEYTGIALQNIAMIYSDKKQYAEAEKYYLQALEIAQQINSQRDVANAYNNLGGIYRDMGNYEKALNYFSKTLKIPEWTDNKRYYSYSLTHIGNMYSYLLNEEKALEYYLQALQIGRDGELKLEITSSLNAVAATYINLQNNEKALSCLQEALQIAEERESPNLQRKTLNTLAVLYSKNFKNYEKALKYQRRALKIAKKSDNPATAIPLLINLTAILQELGQFEEAIKSLLEAEEICLEIGSKKYQKDVYHSFSKLYVAKGNSKKALSFYKKYTAFKDSMFNENTATKIANLQDNYEIVERDKEIVILQKEQELKALQLSKQKIIRNALIFGIILIGLLLLLLFKRITEKKRLNQTLEKKVNERTKELQKEMKERKKTEEHLLYSERLSGTAELASSIAHEIKNPLANINLSAQMLKDELQSVEHDKSYFEIILRNVTSATDTVKKLIEFSKPHEFKLEKGNIGKVLTNTIHMLQSRINKHNVEIKIHNLTEIPDTNIDKVNLQSVFMNIIVNALNAMGDDGNLTIKNEITAEKLILRFQDTGCGICEKNLKRVFDPFFTTTEEGTGLGLSIVHDIMKHHNGQINIKSEEGKGTEIILTFPRK